jgi:hypothetical protein
MEAFIGRREAVPATQPKGSGYCHAKASSSDTGLGLQWEQRIPNPFRSMSKLFSGAQ